MSLLTDAHISAKNAQNLFFELLRKDPDKALSEDISFLNDDDWEELYAFGYKHELLPVFYRRLSGSGLKNIPPAFFSKLKKYYIRNLQCSITFEHELSKIGGIFSDSGIPVIFLKGPALTRFLYGDLGFRKAGSDLDILIKRKEFSYAEEKLKYLGYCFFQGDKTAGFSHKFREQVVMNKKTEYGDIFVDLHWGLRDRFTPTHLDELWLNAKEVKLGTNRMLLPSGEDLLIYLALLAVSDFDFVRISYLFDLHTFVKISGAELDWDAAIDRAKKYGLNNALFFALELSGGLFFTPIPPVALNKIKPPILKEKFLKYWLNKRNVVEAGGKIARSYMWRHFISPYVLSKNILSCIKIICKKIFLPVEEVGYSSQSQSKSDAYLLYIKRLLKPLAAKK